MMKSFALKLVLVACLAMLATSCRNQHIISKSNMVKILTKVYLTDGTINNLDRSKFMRKDTICYYEPILTKYGYTAAQFDSSINYYSHNLDKFDEIFDAVIFELSRIENKYAETPQRPDNVEDSDTTANEWPLKSTFWNVATDTKKNPHIGFDVEIKGLGTYEISYNAQIFEDDSVPAPYFKAYMHYGTPQTIIGETVGSQTRYYKKSDLNQSYLYTFDVSDSLLTMLSGYLYLYDKDNVAPNCYKHAIFSNIHISFTPKLEGAKAINRAVEKEIEVGKVRPDKLKKPPLLSGKQNLKKPQKYE